MISDFLGKEKEGGSMSNEYIKLSDLAQVPGIGKKTLERIKECCEIVTLDEEPKKNEKLSTWLDELLESEDD